MELHKIKAKGWRERPYIVCEVTVREPKSTLQVGGEIRRLPENPDNTMDQQRVCKDQYADEGLQGGRRDQTKRSFW